MNGKELYSILLACFFVLILFEKCRLIVIFFTQKWLFNTTIARMIWQLHEKKGYLFVCLQNFSDFINF